MASESTCAAMAANNGNLNGEVKKELYASRPTNILHRVPWRPPVATSAEGINITLEDGRVLIDAVGGAAVACIGNGHPTVLKAIKDQVDNVAYVYNMQLSNEPAELLANNVIKSSKGAFAAVGFFAGGSEAMDAVLKLSRQYWVEQKQPQRVNYISRNLSYHGNTVGTLQLSGHTARRGPYESILNQSNFYKVSPAYAKRFKRNGESDEEYVQRLAKELDDKIVELGPETVIAFIAETVVGATTGVVAAPKGYFPAIKAVCRKHNVLFILDEVMSGMGRMGTLHGWESFGDGASPDIQAVAKGLGGGYASIGAVFLSPTVLKGIRDSSGFWKHGHTYQAHPLSCAASLAVQKVIEEENLLENCRTQGLYLAKLLKERLASSIAAPYVFDVRGGGLLWAVEWDFTEEFAGPAAAKVDFKGQQFAMLVQARCMVNNLVIMGMTGGANIENTRGDTSIFAPAYNVTPAQVEEIVDRFVRSAEETLREALV